MNDVSTRLAKCFSAVFPELTPNEIIRATMQSVAKWDSIATITLLSVIEEEFGLTFEPHELGELTSYDSILAFLQVKQHIRQEKNRASNQT